MVAALSGAAGSLALPPAAWWPVAYLAPIPLLWLVRGARPRRGALLGFVFGIAYFGTILYWIVLFGAAAWLALILALAAYPAAFGLLAPIVHRPERPVLSTIGLAALWTALEWIRNAFPLGGFAWGELGVSQVDAPSVRLASVTGVWGLSFLVLFAAGLLLLAMERWGSGPARSLGYLVAAVALVVAPAAIPIPRPNGATLDVAAIQVDVASVQGLGGAREDVAVARLNMDLHRTLARDPPDLVVWGEGSLDPGASEDPVTSARVAATIARVGVPTLAGAIVDDPGGSQHTSTLAFDGEGRVVARYDKVKLVPFGEYVPWRPAVERVLGAVDRGALELLRASVPVDRVPGTAVTTISIPGLPRIGTPICYENSFPSIDRTMVRQGAGFLVLTINNASYGRTAASEQQLQMSRLRAVENARWVVHAAVSGVSAFIDPEGRVVDRRGLFEPAVMRREIVASTRTTLYTRFGDWLPLGSLLLVLGLIAAPRRRERRAAPPDPLPGAPRVLMVLPTYDERQTVGDVLDGLLALPDRIDVLVVDDGSPDGTAEIVRGRAEGDPRVRLVERPRKAGLASAYAVGFGLGLEEGYDLIGEMDSDLSHRPEELPRLLEAVRSADVVVGSRYVPGGTVSNWSPARVALSRAGNAYARACLGLSVHDATSGYRLYRREALAAITKTPITSEGYGFQIELVDRAWRAGLTVVEAPISFREREHGRSKISRRIVFEALWQVTRWGARNRLRRASRP